ncbi:MAG: hypothetical protein Q8P26_00690, partial [Candidatus Levybacteria bacterium]|nr:hypothetical protein [Candidatus Levybacteria bacterium]
FYSFKDVRHLLSSFFPLFPFENARYRFLFDLSARAYVALVFKEALANPENQEYLKKLRKAC